jgi:peptidoglycan/LPS O-acetylase OafA/YrhL
LEWAGGWSYSVYLVHVPANAVFGALPLSKLGAAIQWPVQMAFVMAASYLFVLLLNGHRMRWPTQRGKRLLGGRRAGYRAKRGLKRQWREDASA